VGRHPHKRVKLRGVVEGLDRHTVKAKIILGEDWHLQYPPEYYAEIERSRFGPDADRLQIGSYISFPARRDARWMLTPIVPWSESYRKRAEIEARIWAKRMRKLFKEVEA